MTFDDYERGERTNYAAFAAAVASILESAIKADPDLRLQQIQCRAKSPTSLKGKLAKFKIAADAAIEDEVKDLAACRVIFYTNADVNGFLRSDILRGNFVIDWDRTKVHHPVPGTESEGRLFRSDNFVVLLNEQRAGAPEYAKFRSMRCEIQVQTTLNHAWSEMEHDVYKIKPAAGFGKDLLQGIQKRFDRVMREMLIPAGYEFQKIVDDYHRLASGQELIGKGALRVLSECKDNNERHDLLEGFKTNVLPHLDEPAAEQVEIRGAVVAAVRAARSTEPKPIKTHWGDFAGKTADDVVKLAADILDHLRYVNLDAIQSTLDALCELYPDAASDKERERILKSVKTLATHNYEVWKSGGPIVQDILVQRIRGWDRETLEALRPVAMTVLNESLRPEATGTSATYNAITLTTAEVVASDALERIRTTCLDLLEELFRSASNDGERRAVKHALLDATRFPQRGSASPALKLTILQNSGRVARFFGAMAETLGHEFLQNLEHSFLWLYRHARLPAGALAEEVSIADARRAFIDALLAFRDRVNGNQGFVVYKTLVGFESVFSPEWEGDAMDIEGKEAYRNQRISELVGQVNSENTDDWLAILQQCARTRSDDMATFPPFIRFLEELARTKPDIVESNFDRLGADLAIFLPPMLRGLEATTRWPAVKQRVEAWVSERRYLTQVLFHQRQIETVDPELVKRALDFAIEDGNDRAVLNAATICAIRSDAIPREHLGAIFAVAVGYFKTKGETVWADAIWAFVKDSLIESLTDVQIDLVLSALVPRKRIDSSAEWILAAIAKRAPDKVIDFFGDRLHLREDNDVVDHYESVPYSFTKLGPHLATTAPHLITRCRVWHTENKEHFEFRGGRLLSVTFPQLTPELEGLLEQVLAAGGEGAPEFVADVLRGYDGAPTTHELYRAIVEAVPVGDPVLASVEVALLSTGGVSGEFGMREAYQRKKAEIQPWLSDARPRVKAFSEAHDRALDRMIAAEQRRSEEDLEARKRLYGGGANQ